MLSLLAQEVTPDDPASLAWPAVAGGVAAIVITAGTLWRGWRHLRRTVLDPLARMLGDWNGKPAENGNPAVPGVPARMAAMERHLGNGHQVPLRQSIEANAAKLQEITEVAHRADRVGTSALTVAQTAAAQLAEHYVRGHG